MFFKILVNGKEKIYCYSNHNKIDFYKLNLLISQQVKGVKENQVILKKFNPPEDNSFSWYNISPK